MLHKGLDSLADPEMPVNLEGVEYRGINALLLRNAQFNNGYPSSEWATFDQWKKAGHSVRKGEKGTMMFFFIETFEDQGSDAKKKIEYSYANLFNRYQLVHEDSK